MTDNNLCYSRDDVGLNYSTFPTEHDGKSERKSNDLKDDQLIISINIHPTLLRIDDKLTIQLKMQLNYLIILIFCELGYKTSLLIVV